MTALADFSAVPEASAHDVHLWARTAERGERLCYFVGEGLHRALGAAAERVAAARELSQGGRVTLLQARAGRCLRYLAVRR